MPGRAKEPRAADKGAAGYGILVVDDDESILASFRRYFPARGFRVDCAREQAEAEALLSHGRHDLAVLDLHLTSSRGAEGLDILDYIRRSGLSTRVILFTANGSPETEREALRRGADLVLRKPRSLTEMELFALALLGDSS